MRTCGEGKEAGLVEHRVGEPTPPEVGPCDDLHVRIAERAYELYLRRGRRDGYAVDDWLQAERDVLSQVPPA